MGITKESLSRILDLLNKAQDPCTVLSSLILEEFFKRLACHLAGILRGGDWVVWLGRGTQ